MPMDKKYYLKDDSSIGELPLVTTSKRRPKIAIFLSLFLFVILALIVASIFLWDMQRKTADSSAVSIPVATIAPTRSISPTHSVTQDASASAETRKNLSVAVRNGSGQAGAASGMSAFLKKLGYTVLPSANADAFTYTEITIQIKKSKSSMVSLLKEDLSGNYTVTETTTDLSESSAPDALVIVGK